MAYDDQNIFAKILRGEAPAYTVYEDDHAIAFMDLMPQTDGHTLVIPRQGAENLFDADPEVLGNTIRATQKVASAVKTAFEAPGVMILQLNGAAAGQTVFHLHFHIIPRVGGIDLKLHAREMADPERLTEHADRIKAALVFQAESKSA